MSDKSHYCRQHTDARYLPGLIHSVNDLASNACEHGLKVFKGSCLFLSSKQNPFLICRISIRTRNYAITSHIDRTDMLDKSDKEDIFKKWTTMLEDGSLHPVEERRLHNQFIFSVEYGPGVHATCNYQYPLLSSGTKKKTNVKPIVLFVFPALGISKRIRNYETHMWMAHGVQHATCIQSILW